MAQMWLLWWPKTTCSATKSGGSVTTSLAARNDNEGTSCCSYLKKLMRKLRKRGRRTASFECRYDPLSYALNFDTTSLDEDDYYKFCAFSSRFVANPNPNSNPNPRKLVVADALPLPTSHFIAK